MEYALRAHVQSGFLVHEKRARSPSEGYIEVQAHDCWSFRGSRWGSKHTTFDTGEHQRHWLLETPKAKMFTLKGAKMNATSRLPGAWAPMKVSLWRCWTTKTTLHSFWTNKTTTTNILLSITNPESPFLSRKTMFFQIPGASKLCGKLLFNYLFWGFTNQIGHSESFSSFSKHRG